MITNRRTVQVKQNCMEQFTTMILAEARHAAPQRGFRIYTSNISPNNMHVLEIDFDDLAAYERFWRDWVSIDPMPVFNEKYAALVERNIANEIWDRADQPR